ncbi:MAG: type I DNA topoisomerase [Candidatus Omnitrophica bacterium]|nr:type I DNA topoisomerase [Candidatus Omnitrophota bacterium]
MAKALVIVESPAKSKTINKILGKDYVVTSSMGHMIDLPRQKMGIDPKNDFKPEYIVIPERKKYLTQLKKEAKDKDSIYLAPDPDREGEAIAWHLKNELGKGKKVYRVTFDEITERAVKNAFKEPRDINMDLVNAQQARRVLDRLVGYSISPLLWSKVTRGLSAGRVQSIAVRLIVDREREIRAFNPKEYWSIEAVLSKNGDNLKFNAKLEKYQGEKIELLDKKMTDGSLEQIKQGKFVVTDIKNSKKRKKAQPPFTTSKLQQEGFNKLKFPVNKTMRIAQQLYEGIELGPEGEIGLITYMRTDSVKVSKEGQEEAKNYIITNFGKEYYPEEPNIYKSKKSAQEAHECIRPTLPLRDPRSIQGHLSPDQFKLYTIIWNRFISSQMSEASYATIKISITVNDYLFGASGTSIIFDGFMKLYQEDVENDKEKQILPELEKDEQLDLHDLLSQQHFTKPPARYSDASLVKTLEEKGIGRPSTYAPTIQTIIARSYVNRISGYIHPTDLGETVNDLLVTHFPLILDEQFTAGMEESLDNVEQGNTDWVKVIRNFYDPFIITVQNAGKNMQSVNKNAVELEEKCPQCGKPMIEKWGRRGKFLSCSAFPKCKFAKSFTTGVKCPQEGCDGELIERRSRRGPFFGCSKYPKCTYTARTLPKPGSEQTEDDYQEDQTDQ